MIHGDSVRKLMQVVERAKVVTTNQDEIVLKELKVSWAVIRRRKAKDRR